MQAASSEQRPRTVGLPDEKLPGKGTGLLLAILIALFAVALWAFTLVLAKPGLARMDAVAYGLVRPAAASILLLPYVVLTGGFEIGSIPVLLLAALGGAIDMFIGVALFMYAMKRVAAHKAGPLSNTAPLWGVIAATVWLREAPEVTTYIAALLVVAGSYVLASRQRIGEWKWTDSRGLLAALGAGFCWGIADTAIAKYCLTHGMNRATVHIAYMVSAAVCWVFVALLTGRFRRVFYPWRGLRIALTTALTGMVAGMLLWFIALDLAPASVLAPTRGALTVFVLILSVVLLGERPTLRAGLGVTLIGAGVVLVAVSG